MAEGNEFKNGLFGCFGDFRLCLFTFCAPCYTIGKNAEALGEDCLLIGLLAFLGFPFEPILRWRVRQEKGIQGSMMMDVILGSFCGCCTAIQEARELGWNEKKAVEKGEDQSINRQ